MTGTGRMEQQYRGAIKGNNSNYVTYVQHTNYYCMPHATPRYTLFLLGGKSLVARSRCKLYIHSSNNTQLHSSVSKPSSGPSVVKLLGPQRLRDKRTPGHRWLGSRTLGGACLLEYEINPAPIRQKVLPTHSVK